MLSRLATKLTAITFAATSSLFAFTPTEDGLYAVFDTTHGEFTAKLYFEEMPQTVASFVGLAENGIVSFNNDNEQIVKSGFYDGIAFHRIIEGFMIQGGSPNGLGTDGPGYTFPDELRDLISHNKSGLLSMANSGPNTNGSQFFITLAPTTWLNDHHAVFGEIVQGMANVSTIGNVDTDANDRPTDGVTINTISILREGVAASEFHGVQVVQQGDDTFIYREVGSEIPPSLDSNASSITLNVPEDQEKYDYFFRQASALNDWGSFDAIPYNQDSPLERVHTIDLEAQPTQESFFRYSRNAFLQPFDLAGSKISFTIPGQYYGDFVVTLGTNGEGTFTQLDGETALEGAIIYDLHDLGEYEQLYIYFQYSGAYFELQLYLPDGSPNSGTAKAVITEPNPEFLPNKTVSTNYVID